MLELPRRPDGSWSGDFGIYAAAVRRWELVTRRVAPDPLMRGARSPWSLSPVFTEWVMGLPPGHVTGCGLGRRPMFEALGNGVVPRQAAAALELLLVSLSHVDSAA